MKILSAIHWRTDAAAAIRYSPLLLKHVGSKRGQLLLAVVCVRGGGQEGTDMADRLIGEAGVWFEQNYMEIMWKNHSLRRVRRGLALLLDGVGTGRRDGAAYSGDGRAASISLALLLIWKKKYITMQCGEAGVYRLAGRPPRGKLPSAKCRPAHIDRASQRRRKPRTLVLYTGCLRRKTGFLLCGDGFIRGVSHRQLHEALYPAAMKSEEQMTKRLAGIADYVTAKSGPADMAALYVATTK